METKEIKKGDLTNRGIVKMVDTAWTHKDGTPADVLVITDQGPFRMSELQYVEKAGHPEPRPIKDPVTFDTVMSLDIRPGFVRSAQRVPKTDKLIQMEVRTALGNKTVVTNLGGEYEPSHFIGRTFMFVMNMPPVTMKGVVSEAMIVAASGHKYNPTDNKWDEYTYLVDLATTVDYTIL